jgi:hypothetical protein
MDRRVLTADAIDAGLEAYAECQRQDWLIGDPELTVMSIYRAVEGALNDGPARFEPTPKGEGDVIISSPGIQDILERRAAALRRLDGVGGHPSAHTGKARTPSPAADPPPPNPVLASLARAKELLGAALIEAAASEQPRSPS